MTDEIKKTEEQTQKEEKFDFAEVMRKNQEKKNQLKENREKDNKGVIRTYGLK